MRSNNPIPLAFLLLTLARFVYSAPSISGSADADDNLQWQVSIPSTYSWDILNIVAIGASYSFTQSYAELDGQRIINGANSSYSASYDGANLNATLLQNNPVDQEVLILYFFATPSPPTAPTFEITVTLSFESDVTITETLTNTISLMSSSSSSGDESTSDVTSSAESSTVVSSSSDAILTSAATKSDISTTLITTTTCEEDKCVPTSITTGVTVVTTTVHGVVTSYTTYCPIDTTTDKHSKTTDHTKTHSSMTSKITSVVSTSSVKPGSTSTTRTISTFQGDAQKLSVSFALFLSGLILV